MANKCSICSNLRCDEINAAIENSGVFRRIAADFCVPETNLRRHAANCIPARIEEARELGLIETVTAKVEKLKPAMSTLGRVEYAFGLLEVALKQTVQVSEDGTVTLRGEPEVLAGLLREMRGWNDQRAKLYGEYQAKAPNEEAEKRKAQRLQQRATEIAKEFNRPVESVVQDLTAQLEQ